jgi:hypothetical protein
LLADLPKSPLLPPPLAEIREIGDGVIGHYAATLFLRLRDATSSGWG